MLARTMFVGLIATSLMTHWPEPASASDGQLADQEQPVRYGGGPTGEVVLVAEELGTPPAPSTPGSTSVSPSAASELESKCSNDGVEVPCHLGGATWSVGHDCYVKRADPQPHASSALWDGHRDADGKPTGAIYQCVATSADPTHGDWRTNSFWAGANPVADAVDPGALAARAVASMHLRAGELGATPLPGAGARSVVGLPTWMWVADVGDQTWGPISRTATAGSVSVTAVAEVADVSYDMGDGHLVRCVTPGTPWTEPAGAAPSPDCGYRYREAGDYTITADSHWAVRWHGAGQSGTITFTLTSTREVSVTELQVVVTR